MVPITVAFLAGLAGLFVVGSTEETSGWCSPGSGRVKFCASGNHLRSALLVTAVSWL
jgi:hypothetical protein